MLGNHPVTPVLLATDLAAASEFYHGKLGLQIDREDENGIVFRCGSGTRLDVTEAPLEPPTSRPRQRGRSATSALRWRNSAPAASRSKTTTTQG
jgi:catechol 2,3-dioxygenase-like lactoylglutathione lyase family enzyme